MVENTGRLKNDIFIFLNGGLGAFSPNGHFGVVVV